jgi:hypothetical protein
MTREKRSAAGRPPNFVWEGDDPAAPGAPAGAGARPAAKQDTDKAVTAGAAGAAGAGATRTAVAPPPSADRTARGLPRGAAGRALIAAAVLVPLAGGTYVLVSSPTRHDAVATAARVTAVPDPARSATPSASPSPSVRPSPSPKPKPSPSATLAPSSAPVATRVVTVAAAPPAAAPSAAGPTQVGAWLLDGNALDATGAHDGTADTVTWSGGAAEFTGADDSEVTTSGPVLDTGAGDSFTVSAWLELTSFPVAPHYNATAVSQDASVDSGFYLQYFGPQNLWAFARVDSDTQSAAAHRALSDSTPQLDTWTHLVGVYDASRDALYLYVDGQLQGTAIDPTPFAANGDLAIGRAFYDGAATDGFTGLVKDVRVFDQALSSSEVGSLG